MHRKKRGIFLVFFVVSLLFFLISAFSVSAGYCANPAASSYCSGKSVSITDCCPSSSDDYGEDGAPTSQSNCKNNFYSSSSKSVGELCTTIGCCYIDTEQTCDDSSLYGACKFDRGVFDSEGCDGSTVGTYCTEGCCIYYEGGSDTPTSVVSSAGFCDTSVDGDFTEGVTDTTDPSCSELAASYVEAAIECDDDVDNDGDGYTDYPLDAGCSSATDSSEQDDSKACDDGADNDGDGSIDTADTGCCEDSYTSNEQLCELNDCTSGEITTACNCYDDTIGILQAEGTYCEAGNSCIAGVCSAVTAECSSGEREYCGISENDCLEYRYCEESVWSDCQETEACGKEPEICTDGTDQDGDGLVDCDDIDCYETKCGDSSGYSACGEKGYTEDNGITYLCCSTSNVNDCNGDSFSDTCGSCECITYLPHIAPEIDAVEFTLGKPQLTVSWTLACQVTFDLRRCTGDDCLTDSTDLTDSEIEEAFPEIPGPNIEDAWEYTDATIGVNERYCYVVQAGYPDGSSAYSQPTCVDDSGDYWCQKMSTSEFCLDSYEGMSEELVYRVGCTGENRLSYLMDGKSCRAEYGADYLCIGPYDDGTTSCEYQSNCATCGDPLGLYAVLDVSILLNNDDDNYGVLCSEIPTCYFDYTRTTTNAFQECAQVSSCYDYASKSACEKQSHTTDRETTTTDRETTYTNKCLQRDCVWVDLSSGDIPSGICKEKSDNYARCDACNEAVHNGIFDACTKERCKQFSVDDADCYLSRLTKLCTDIADFTCSAYDDERSCIGYNGNYVKVDADTNEITQISEDYLYLGLCYWNKYIGDSGECYKDANGDGEADLGQEDMTPPVTTILTPNKMRALNITVLASDFNEDGSLGDGVKATYYCLSDDGSFCRPEDAVELSSSGVGSIELGDGSGAYVLYYYSEDHAENLEVVQEYSFEVDKKGPVITIDYYVGVDTSEPYDASSLTFEISLDEEAYCTDYFETGESQIDNEFNDHFVVKYTDLSDGGYLYNVTCVDSLGNNGEGFVLAYVDADSAIFDSSPYYYSDSNSVTLSVKTVQDADCGFSEGKEETSFVAMDEGFEKEQGAAYYLHSREWTLNENGVYYFDVKCDLADGAVSDDEIEFVYDDTAPTTAVVDSFGDAFGFASFYTGENLDMYLACSDEPFFGFGCDVTYYCIDTSTCTPTTAYDPTDAIPYTLDVSKAYLCYFSIEKTFAGIGGLQETPSCTEIKIDSYTPTLTITNPSDGAVVYIPEVTVTGSVDDPDATEGTAINTVSITVKDTEGSETTYSGIAASDTFSYTVPVTLENKTTSTYYNYITVTGTDRSGANTNSETVRVLYTKELGEDAIWIVEPDNGVSDTAEFDFTIGTLLEAEKCGYSKNNAALAKSIPLLAVASDTAGEFLYSASYSIDTSKNGIEEYVYVKCLLENGEEYSAKFTLEYDTTKPVIEDIEILNSDGKTPPSVVEEPLDPEIQVTTDDRTKCKYSFDADDGFNTGMTKFDDYDNASYNTTNMVVLDGLDDLKSYILYITCQNGAYLTSATESLSFSINSSAASGMYLIDPEASGSRTFTITLGTTRSATGCDYGTSEDALSTTLTQIDDKGKEWETESITVTSDGNYTYYFGCWFVDGYSTDYFTLPVDTTAPIVDYVEDGNVSFSNTTLSATWSASDSLTEIVGYIYALGTKPGYNDTFPWTNTTAKEIIVEGLELENQSTYYWSVKAINEVDLISTSKSSDGVFIDASGSGASWSYNKTVDDVEYHPCANDDLDEGETDIDCGGEDCDSCEAGQSCIVAEDCSSLNCDSGICQEATCDDGIINQGESDSDCGGNYCYGCGEGYACIYHRDCDSGYCEGKTCTAASCDDGVENGDETGIDCGGSCATCEEVILQPSPPTDKSEEKGLPWWLWTIIVLLVAGAALGGYYGYIWYMKKKGKLPPGFSAFGGLGKKLPQLPPLGKLPGFGKLPQKFQMPSMKQIAQQKALQQKQQLREKYFTAFEEKPKEAKVSEKLPEKPTKTPEKEKKTAPEKLGEKLVAKKPVKKEPSKAFTELEKLIKEKKK